jgi:CNT family concentrative nucleoside transporter
LTGTPWWTRLVGVLGIGVIIGLAWAFSTDRKRVSWRLVGWGIGLQILLGVLILKTGPGLMVFNAGRAFVNRLLSFTDAGAGFLFGNLYRGDSGVLTGAGPGPGPIQVRDGGTGDFVDLGIVIAFHVLPTIIFFSSLMSVLYHLGVMQRLVRVFALAMQKTMGTSGSETLSCAANVFVGQTEAPLVVRPFISTMTMSELNAIMVGGFATVAGGVMAAYVRFGIDAGHLLAASVMSAPAALVMAKLLYPETEVSKTAGSVKLEIERDTANVIDAAAKGAADGLMLALNVGAMLMAFIALIALINWSISWLPEPVNSLQEIFGWVFAPISFFMGVEPKDVLAFGNLLGTKVAINEFVAYVELNRVAAEISPRTYIIATYALCGFANFSSIAIQIGGIGGIAPERRKDLAQLGLRAMFGGALASWLTATIAGILL